VEIRLPGVVLTLTSCKACGVLIGAGAREFGAPLELRLRKIEDRLTAIEKRMAEA